MPRKAKDKVEEIDKKEETKEVKKKASTTKEAATTKKTATAKKTTAKKSTTTKSKAEKKETKATKPTAKKATAKKSTTKATKKTTTDKPTTTRKRTTKKAAPVEEAVTPILEYYDLPYKYGNTVVRLLAQTPKTLFVYWEVSDADIAEFKRIYGNDFFNKTKPVLIVHNLTKNKTTEIEINDFANCWYLNAEDADCKYDIELARKYIKTEDDDMPDEYLYIAQSNSLESPNNHILFEKMQEFVVFRNTNTDNKVKKNVKSLKFLKDIYKFYKDMYDEDILNNPSSQFKF